MRFIQSFRIAIKAILAKKGRSFLTMLGIIIGVAAVIILVSLVQGYRDQMMDYWAKQGENKIQINYSLWNSAKQLEDELYAYCQSLDDYIEGVTPSANIWGGNVQHGTKRLRDSQIFLGSDQFSVCNGFTLEMGRDLSYVDVKNLNRVCVLGDYANEQLFNFENPIGKNILIKGERFTVIGVYKPLYGDDSGTQDEWMHQYYDGAVVIPYTLKRILEPSLQINAFVVKARDKESTTKAISYLGNWFSSRISADSGYYDVSSTNTVIDSNNEETRMLKIVLGGIAGIALLVGGIGIMNIMLVTVKERTREIGIRKAIGAERRTIISQFLIESSVLSFIGGLIGIAVGCLGTLVLGKILFNMTLYPSMGIGLGAAGVSVLIGMLFGAYPAIRASGLQPVEALRGE